MKETKLNNLRVWDLLSSPTKSAETPKVARVGLGIAKAGLQIWVDSSESLMFLTIKYL